MENVPAARRGKNVQTMISETASAGYILCHTELNSADCGLPQDRRRAWFAGVRNDVAERESIVREKFADAISTMKLDHPVPVSNFIIPADSDYLVEVMSEKRRRAEKKMLKEHARNELQAKLEEKQAEITSKKKKHE